MLGTRYDGLIIADQIRRHLPVSSPHGFLIGRPPEGAPQAVTEQVCH